MRFVHTLAALAVSLPAAPAAAAPTARLIYSRAEGAQSCPDEMALRVAVAARIGHDPFLPWARRTVVAQISRAAQSFVGSVDLIDEGGMSHGARELRTRGDCAEVLDAVALAIAIAIDPQTLAPKPTSTLIETDPIPPIPTATSSPTPPPAIPAFIPMPAPAPTPRPGPRLEALAGFVASTGFAPSTVAAGLELGATLRWARLSAGVEGRVDAPSGEDLGGGHVATWLVGATLAPCGYLGSVMACERFRTQRPLSLFLPTVDAALASIP